MKRLFVIVTAVALLGAGCAKQQPPKLTSSDQPTAETSEMTTPEQPAPERDLNQPLGYEMGTVPMTAEHSLLLVRNTFTPEMLAAMSDGCGSGLDTTHFESLLGEFEYQRGHRYDFLYRGESQEPSTYTLTVFANEPGYADIDALKKDFDVCAAGSTLYPLDLNENWLVFQSSCGTGYDDGSDLPVGCDEMRDQILNTLEIN